jgi:hypothetical protein
MGGWKIEKLGRLEDCKIERMENCALFSTD